VARRSGTDIVAENPAAEQQAVNRLRNRLLLVFLAATLAPLAATLWITTTLLDRSLSLATTNEVDELSRSLQVTGRALFTATQEALKVESAHLTPRVFRHGAVRWPEDVRQFFDGGEAERFQLAGEPQDRIDYLVRRGSDVYVYSKPIAGPGMKKLAGEYAKARALVEKARARDLRRGFFWTLVLAAAAIWAVCLVALTLVTSRITRPMEQLTAGLAELASGNLDARLAPRGHDEIGKAMWAFNDSAERLRQGQERLVHVTRLASWQTLARKMAHEVKNSLTPIRLTMEEILARRGERDERFLEQACQIVVDEVVTLEKRVRAFSQFAAEPPVQLAAIDVNALVEERICFLKNGHPSITYETRFDAGAKAIADEDLIKGVITNLLENAAEAAGSNGVVLGKTYAVNGKIAIEVHDSGPGLSENALGSLFEPTISFKKSGMGLGLSIARRSALMSGGDIESIEGELGGAAFRVTLPRANGN
jgi:two-component system, NtrC family, nitrogen regulation sensor histidine kinase NtrY